MTGQTKALAISSCKRAQTYETVLESMELATKTLELMELPPTMLPLTEPKIRRLITMGRAPSSEVHASSACRGVSHTGMGIRSCTYSVA
jgi:hypothetical protein